MSFLTIMTAYSFTLIGSIHFLESIKKIKERQGKLNTLKLLKRSSLRGIKVGAIVFATIGSLLTMDTLTNHQIKCYSNKGDEL